MRRLFLLGVAVSITAACTKTVYVKQQVPSSTTPVAPSPTESAKPKPVPVVLRGLYNGTCNVISQTETLTGQTHQTVHWHFIVKGKNSLRYVSKSGGYEVDLNRTNPMKFYGSTQISGAWERSVKLLITHATKDGLGTTLEGTMHDRNSDTSAFVNFSCHLRAA